MLGLVQSRAPDWEQLPFAPGTSPFRLKGTGYRGHMAYAAANVPGGTDAMIRAMRDPRLRAFFEQPFLASSWYDILPLLPAGHACAALMGKPYDDYLRQRTRMQAKTDLSGVYSVLLKFVSTENVALRLPRLLSKYFDFGRIETTTDARGAVTCVSSGIPRILFHWYHTVLTTYVTVALEVAGAPPVTIDHTPPEPDGAVVGAATVRFRWHIRWGG
jgi:hypothetical protein